jgi:hypothetical protein
MYRELDSALIIATARALSNRIAERFPESGLARVGAELLAIAAESDARIARIRRPHWPLRILSALGVVLLAALVVSAIVALTSRPDVGGVSDMLQGIEAAINDIIFAAVAVFFLSTIEARIKRRVALKGLHELRSLAHIVDMHQLTKDPESIVSPAAVTASSPRREMTRFQLARYLDYCSELLSLTSKLAALHAQYLNDPVVLGAVNDVQELSLGLSGKIWQKIVILDTVALSAEQT